MVAGLLRSTVTPALEGLGGWGTAVEGGVERGLGGAGGGRWVGGFKRAQARGAGREGLLGSGQERYRSQLDA